MVIIPLMLWGERKGVFVSLKPIEMKLHSSLRYIDRVASIHLSLASRAALSDSDAGQRMERKEDPHIYSVLGLNS